MTSTDLNTLIDELSEFYLNLRAEVVLAELQQNEVLDHQDVMVHFMSAFSRPYRRDVLVAHDGHGNSPEPTLHLELSRNGIYDNMPEGFFHQSLFNKNTSFASFRNKLKEEERNARSFFKPIENEFFYQDVCIEENERQLLDNFYSLDDDYLLDFWKLDRRIPKKYLLKLVKLLPYCHKIAGNIALARLSLEKLLEVPVTFEKKFKDKSLPDTDSGDLLGIDMVTDSESGGVFCPILEVVIGPADQGLIDHYLEKNGIRHFFETFYSYFLPLELEVITKFVMHGGGGFVLNDEKTIMGISTVI